MIEGKEVVKSERIKAQQNLSQLESELQRLSEANIIKKQIEVPDENAYTVEYRKKLYREMEQERLKNEEEKKKSKDQDPYWKNDYNSKPLSVYKEDGEIRICNQGRYQFYIEENKPTGIMTFELAVPRHLDTSQIKLDLNVKYVRVEIKGKITQWRFDNEIYTEDALIQRSQTSGFLLIKAFMVGFEDKYLNKKNITSSVGVSVNKMLLEDDMNSNSKKDLSSTDKRLYLESSLNKDSQLKKIIENQEKEKKEKTFKKNKTIYYGNNSNSNNIIGENLKPIDSLTVINNNNNNNSSSNNRNKSNNNNKLINYNSHNNFVANTKEGLNSIQEVKNQDSMINPEQMLKKKQQFEEIVKDVDLDEIPELD